MNTASSNGLSVVLLVLCAGLGTLLYGAYARDFAVVRPQPSASPEGMHATPATAVSAHTLAAPPPLGRFSAIVERPLFSESRRPDLPEPVKQEPAVAAEVSFAIIGVVLSTSGDMALVERKRTRKTELITKGERIDGWLVESIRPDQVTLSNGDIRRVVVFEQAPAKPHTARTVAPDRRKTSYRGRVDRKR